MPEAASEDRRVLVFKEREGRPGGGKGLLVNRKSTYTISSTDKVPMICYEESVSNTPPAGSMARNSKEHHHEI